MPFEYVSAREQDERRKAGGLHTLAERTYLDASRTRALPEGHPDAAFLLGAKGNEIPLEDAVALGLVEIKLDEAEDKQLEVVTEDKAAPNKSTRRREGR